MKRAVIAATALLIILANCISVFAENKPNIKIDGKIDGREWASGQYEDLYYSNNSNHTTNLTLTYIFEGENTAYYLFTFVEEKPEDVSKLGITIWLENWDPIELDYSNRETPADNYNDEYRIEAALSTSVDTVSPQEASKSTVTVYCEVMVNYKKGTGKVVNGSVLVTDGKGEKSNIERFSFENSDYTTTDIDSDANTSRTAKETTTKRRVRDRESSSKTPISTSRVVTTERATAAKKATTTQKVTTEKATAVKTTKAKTTKAGTTKAKHAIGKAAEADEVSVSVVTSIVYVVPETIISGTVYVTDETEQGNEKSAFDIKNMQKSTVMKIAAGGAALLLFGAIGIAAVKNKKDNGKDDTGTE